MSFPALAAVGSALAGPIISMIGQQQTNESNAQIASAGTAANMAESQRNREFQQASADKEMAFQERMANTSYQRGREDLEKAGFNPIMAALNSGASTPSGSHASGSSGSAQQATMENTLSGFANTGRNVQDMMKGYAEINLINSQAKKAQAEERATRGGTASRYIGTDFYDGITGWVKRKVKEANDVSAMYERSLQRDTLKNQQKLRQKFAPQRIIP